MADTIKGEKGNQELEVGKVYLSVHRLINSVWSITFVPLKDGSVFILSNSRDNKDGYDQERTALYGNFKEGEGREVQALILADPTHSFTDLRNEDIFPVRNKKYIFDYNEIDFNEIKDVPELAHLKGKVAGKKFGLNENRGYFMLFEDFKKNYSDKMTIEEFKKLKKGDKVLYMGSNYKIVEPGEHVIKVEDVKKPGVIKSLNFAMFNKSGAIR